MLPEHTKQYINTHMHITMNSYFSRGVFRPATIGLLALGTMLLQAAAQLNDNFANASVLRGSFAQVDGNTVGSTEEAGEPDDRAVNGGIWYRWTSPGYNGTLAVSLNIFSSGSFSHWIHVFQATGSGSIFEVAQIQRRQVRGGDVETIRVAAAPSTTYYIRIAPDNVGDRPSPVQVTIDHSPKNTWASFYAQSANSYRFFANRGDTNNAAAYYFYFKGQGDYTFNTAFGNTAAANFSYYESIGLFNYYTSLAAGNPRAANFNYYYYALAYYNLFALQGDFSSAAFFYNFYIGAASRS